MKLTDKEKKRAYDRVYRRKYPTSSAICKICGIIGGRGPNGCFNEPRHESLIRSKLLISKMREESYLLKVMGTTAAYKDLKETLDNIEEEKGRSIKIRLKRKKRSISIV